LPLIEAPAGLEQRILHAERQAHAGLPMRQRVGRVISIMAGYAMRPQLAMAALLVLMIGASLLFLRARPGGRDNVQVTERGVPEGEGESVALVPVPEKLPGSDTQRGAQAHGALEEVRPDESRRERSKSETAASEPVARDDKASGSVVDGESVSATAAAPGRRDDSLPVEIDAGNDSEYDQAMAAYRGGRYAEAQRLFETVAATGGPNAPSASLLAAQSARNGTGCSIAAPRFDEVNTRYPGSHIGNEAAWQAADCYRALGQRDRARKNYQALLAAAGYAERAQRAIETLDEEERKLAARRAARPAAKAKAPAAAEAPRAAPPAKAAPSPNAEQKNAF